MSGAALSGDGRPQAGMGVDAGDYNGDGLPDLIVTNFSHDYNTLYENGPPACSPTGATRPESPRLRGPYLGWGVKFVDLDNDGRLDIFIANGHVYPEVDEHGLGTRYLQRKQVFLNEGTRFRDASDGDRRRAAAREVEPRRRVRRLRQRRRHRRARHQHERAADAAAQRHAISQSLDHASPGREARATATPSARASASTRASVARRHSCAATAATCRTATCARTSGSQRRRASIGSRSAGRAASSTPRRGSLRIGSMLLGRGRGSLLAEKAEGAGFF